MSTRNYKKEDLVPILVNQLFFLDLYPKLYVVLGYFLALCEQKAAFELSDPLELPGEVLKEEGLSENSRGQEHLDEARDMEEMWVHYAILDLAYYIRSHKFNEYDRRYVRDPALAIKEYYKKFPDPPLRTFHWEVNKHCSEGFLPCLKYAVEYTNIALLQKDSDPVYLLNQGSWSLAENKHEIEAANEECKRLFKDDYEAPAGFVGPIHRFQWRTTISYYMCYFSLQKQRELAVFGERCDNYANCLPEDYEIGNNDPRADDSIPYNCAVYSFCPDLCCPVKRISSLEECVNHDSNPCPKDRENRTCVFDIMENQDLLALSLNRWNLSCHCEEKGIRWESRFGMCVDINECEEGSHNCSDGPETCLNLRGSFRCGCTFGFLWDEASQYCAPMDHSVLEMSSANLVLRPDKSGFKKNRNKKKLLKKLFSGSKSEEDEEK